MSMFCYHPVLAHWQNMNTSNFLFQSDFKKTGIFRARMLFRLRVTSFRSQTKVWQTLLTLSISQPRTQRGSLALSAKIWAGKAYLCRYTDDESVCIMQINLMRNTFGKTAYCYQHNLDQGFENVHCAKASNFEKPSVSVQNIREGANRVTDCSTLMNK